MCRAGVAALILVALAVPARAAEPLPVHAQSLASLLQPVHGDAPATTLSLNDGWLEAEISAPVVAVRKRVGEAAARDDVLVQLDCRKFRRAVELARAQMAVLEARRALARQQLERARGLERSRSIAEETLNQREAELATVTAELEAQRVAVAIAQDDVGRCQLRAPFAGVVLERRAQLGEVAAPGKPLLRLVDRATVEVSAQLALRDVASLEQAATVRFRHGVVDYPVRLRALAPVVDPRTGTREARLEFTAERPPPGAAGRLRWALDAGVLPARYLVRRGEALGVLLAHNGRARFTPVPGAEEGRSAQVNLDPAAQVITRGRYALDDGDPIRVLPAEQ